MLLDLITSAQADTDAKRVADSLDKEVTPHIVVFNLEWDIVVVNVSRM